MAENGQRTKKKRKKEKKRKEKKRKKKAAVKILKKGTQGNRQHF